MVRITQVAHETREQFMTNMKTVAPVAAYARTSSPASLSWQKQTIAESARKMGYIIVRWYCDTGLRPEKPNERSAFGRMLDDLEKGDLVTTDVTRLRLFEGARLAALLLQRGGVKVAVLAQE